MSQVPIEYLKLAYLVTGSIAAGVALFVANTFFLPRLVMYRKFRTWLFRKIPYTGAIVRTVSTVSSMNDTSEIGTVINVYRKRSEILVRFNWQNSDGSLLYVREEWYTADQLEWLPWYLKDLLMN